MVNWHQGRNSKLVSPGLLGKVGLLKITSHPSAAGPSAAVDGQDVPSRNNQEEKSKFCIWSLN